MPRRIKLKGEQFSQTFKFVHFYNVNHDTLLAKYNTYTAKEESELYNHHRSGDDDIFSLQFHLEKRKTMKAQGISLPFYINQEEMPF